MQLPFLSRFLICVIGGSALDLLGRNLFLFSTVLVIRKHIERYDSGY